MHEQEDQRRDEERECNPGQHSLSRTFRQSLRQQESHPEQRKQNGPPQGLPVSGLPRCFGPLFMEGNASLPFPNCSIRRHSEALLVQHPRIIAVNPVLQLASIDHFVRSEGWNIAQLFVIPIMHAAG
jgi:hypothetical protein